MALISGVNRLIKPGLILTLILMVHGFWLIPAFFITKILFLTKFERGTILAFQAQLTLYFCLSLIGTQIFLETSNPPGGI